MNRISKLATVAVLLIVSTASFSASLAGKWTGKLSAQFKPPAAAKADAEAVKKVNKTLGEIRIILVIDAKGTYKATTKRPNLPDVTSHGTWKLKGKQISLTPSDKRPPEVGTLSKDGKSMTVALPAATIAQGIVGSVVFKKG